MVLINDFCLLFMKYINKIKSVVNSGTERSVKAKKNIIYMLFLKGGNILIGLLLVPMTIGYVDSENYGIWLTLSSMVAWMSFFNIGLNNGLKNKLGDALSKGDLVLGKKYVSTTYALLSLIFIPLMIILLTVVPYINWYDVLNVSVSVGNSLLTSICILITYFCLNFVLSTINMVLHADQNPAGASSRDLLQQFLSLIIIWILTLTTEGDLLKLCVALCATPLVVSLIFNITLFTGRYKEISPSIGCVDFKVAPSLLSLGIKFFVIQIAGIIQYQMANFLILRYIGAIEVTKYNIAYKYISVLLMVWSIFTTPLWSAVTDAVAKNDMDWIRNTLKKYSRMLFLFSVVGVVMVIVSPFVYKIWIGDKVSVSLLLSSFVFLYVWVMMYGSVFVQILNGAGKLNLQMYSCFISPLIYIGVFFLCNNVFHFGIISVLIASILSNFNGFLIAPLQCRYYLNLK